MVQRWRIRPPMQGTWARSLLGELRSHRPQATKPVCHNERRPACHKAEPACHSEDPAQPPPPKKNYSEHTNGDIFIGFQDSEVLWP